MNAYFSTSPALTQLLKLASSHVPPDLCHHPEFEKCAKTERNDLEILYKQRAADGAGRVGGYRCADGAEGWVGIGALSTPLSYTVGLHQAYHTQQ